eukprot:10693449-Alexandrium_andersonii.AAC.1
MDVTATDHVTEWPGGCGHAYHMVCLMEFLARKDEAARCPLCDTDLRGRHRAPMCPCNLQRR